ncbi:hypothetical protein [Streptomyces sp. NPDC049040]|uniref:hypothetical protein n=1 Tax=Streptomyces sp. NPDC049040 TaxID=3365593 RepID=UPI00371400EB
MTTQNASAPTDDAGRQAAGERVRQPCARHREADGFGRPGTPAPAVPDHAARAGREGLVGDVAGHPGSGVGAPVPDRAFAYRRSAGQGVGGRIAAAVRPG